MVVRIEFRDIGFSGNLVWIVDTWISHNSLEDACMIWNFMQKISIGEFSKYIDIHSSRTSRTKASKTQSCLILNNTFKNESFRGNVRNLNWNEHVANLATFKVKKLGFLFRGREYLYFSKLCTLYVSQIMSNP